MRKYVSVFLLLVTVSLFANPDAESAREDADRISSGIKIARIVVKFRESAVVRLRENGLASLGNADLSAVNSALKGIPLKPLFIRSEEDIDFERMALKASAPSAVADKNSYFQIDLKDHTRAEEVLKKLRSTAIVETVYIEPEAELAQDVPPPTPDFSGDQGYLYSPPGGIGADFSWSIPGGTGQNVHIIDIEGNWTLTHEDFGSNFGSMLAGNPVPLDDWINHGTATTGEIGGDSNSYGITGIAHDAQIDLISIDGIGIAAAVDYAASVLNPGDIIMIELHTPGPRYNFESRPDQLGYVPMEYFQATFDAIQIATAKGIFVVEAAGNGAENLDDEIYENRFDRSFRDSRAILVGAGVPPNGIYGIDRTRLYFSNYGSRVDLQGWGKSVTTTGYGGLFSGDGDENQYYTQTFGGTSGATPIVAGAVACIEGIFEAAYGVPLSVDALAALLTYTGSMQPNPNEWIGPRPNLPEAYQFLPGPGLSAQPGLIQASGSDYPIQVYVTLINEDSQSPRNFVVTIDDTLEGLGQAGWLEVSPTSGTIVAGGLADLTVTLDPTLLDDTTYHYKGMISVSYGAWTSLKVPVFFTVICQETDYAVDDSDNESGPDFQWIDITAIGTKLLPSDFHNDLHPTLALDDGTSKAIPIGFPFNFFNDVFAYVYAGVNGGLSFVTDEVNVNGYFANIDLPAPGIEALLLPFWNDLTIDAASAGHGAVYYYNSPGHDSLVIEYFQIGNFGSQEDSLITFEVVLTSNHKITYQFLDVGLLDLDYAALVGLSRDQGCRMVEYYEPGYPLDNTPHDQLRVDFMPAYQIEMRSGDANSSGNIDIDDIVFLITYVFGGGPAPQPPESGDCDCLSGIDIDDIVYLIVYVFSAGPEPCLYYP